MKTCSDWQHATFLLVESLWWRDHIVSLTVVTCPRPGNIDRGYVSSNDDRDYDYGETVKYGCNGDYVLEGSLEIVCQQNGKWSEKPSCKGRATTYITVTLHDTFLVITIFDYCSLIFPSAWDLQLRAALPLREEGYSTKDEKSGSETWALTESYTKISSQSTAGTRPGTVVTLCQPSASMENSKFQTALNVSNISWNSKMFP